MPYEKYLVNVEEANFNFDWYIWLACILENYINITTQITCHPKIKLVVRKKKNSHQSLPYTASKSREITLTEYRGKAANVHGILYAPGPGFISVCEIFLALPNVYAGAFLLNAAIWNFPL